MSYKLLIVDADGTIRKAISNDIAPSHPTDFTILPGAARWFKANRGALWGIASNQGGVHFGYVSEEDAFQALWNTARALGGLPDGAIRMCTSMDKSDPRRKPNAGMLKEVADFYGFPLKDCLYVGDRPEDEQAAKNAGCDFRWASDFFGD